MAFANVEIERAGRIVTLWMNRPQRRNAFNAELIAELTEALGEAESDDQSRVVVLAGRGASFCAGADLGWMKAYAKAEPEKNLDDARRLAALLRRLAELRKPTIARVHGPAAARFGSDAAPAGGQAPPGGGHDAAGGSRDGGIARAAERCA